MEISEIQVVTIREHQRLVPLRGWSGAHLMALDPHAYAGPGGGANQPDAAAPLAADEKWVDDGWRVRIAADETDSDGWLYGKTSRGPGNDSRCLRDACSSRAARGGCACSSEVGCVRAVAAPSGASRGDATATTWIFRGRSVRGTVAATPRGATWTF